MRQLKYSEKKLLKHNDLFKWDVSNNLFENKVMKIHHIDRREDFVMYNKISRMAKELANKIKALDAKDPVRGEYSARLIEKLHSSGLTRGKDSLELCGKVTVWSLCNRRLAAVMVNIKMVENIKVAVQLIKYGNVRVGADVVTDPATLVTR